MAEVYVGGRTDNSVDFLDLEPLVSKLRSTPDQPPIFIEDFNVFRLWFLMPEARRRSHAIGASQNTPLRLPPGSLLVLYRSARMADLRDGQELKIEAIKALYQAQLSTRNHLVATIE